MITISKYSNTMYVVRGSTGVYKNKLKSYGMKWTRKLKGGPGYIFRIRPNTDLYLLKVIKDFVSSTNIKEQNNTDIPTTTTTTKSNKRKRSEIKNYQPVKRKKSYHAPPFEPVYDTNDDMFLIYPIAVLSWLIFIVSIYQVLNVFYNKRIFKNFSCTCTDYYKTIFENMVDSMYDYISCFEYSKFNFTIAYPVINFPIIDEYRYDYYLTY